MAIDKTVTTSDIYARCNEILGDRGAEYESSGTKERSFQSVADCFNAKTGMNLTAAHICLILSDLKDVRQFSQDRLHEDSVIDGVNYKALMGVELFRQYGKVEIEK